MNSPEVCTMLDRTGVSSRKAVGIISAILKAGKINGKEVDLSEFSLSRTTLERKRINNRSVVLERVMEEFKEKKPKLAALHWDGKLIKDVTGTLQENVAIVISCAPYYQKEKLLSLK